MLSDWFERLQRATAPPAPSTVNAAPPSNTPARSARSYAIAWLALSEDPRFSLEELRATYFRLCSTTTFTDRDRTAFDIIERDVARTFGGMGRFDSQTARNRLRRVLAAYALHDPEVGYCLTEEHEILTSQGFLSLKDIEAYTAQNRSSELLFAGYDEATKTMVYEPTERLITNPAREQTVVEFTQRKMEFDAAYDHISDSTNCFEGVSVVVTPEHDMYAKRSSAKQRMVNQDENNNSNSNNTNARITNGYDDHQPVGSSHNNTFAKVKARDLVPSPTNTVADDIIFRANAENGIAYSSNANSDALTEVALKSAILDDSFAPWVWTLPKDQAKQVLVRLANDTTGKTNAQVADCTDSNTQPNATLVVNETVVVEAHSARFRDDIVRLALHAGYSPHFVVVTPSMHWRITCSTALDHTQSRLHPSTDVTHTSYTGRTWCVTLPHGLIWARRVKRDENGAVLHASRPVITGNCQGMNFLTGFALMYTDDEADTFALLVRIMMAPAYHLRGLYQNNLPEVGVTSFVMKQLLWKHVPELAHHLELIGCDPVFFFEWYFTLFTYILAPEQCAEVWEMFFADGWSAIFKVMIALLVHASPFILGTDFQTTVQALKGYKNYRLAEEFPSMRRNTRTTIEGMQPHLNTAARSDAQQPGEMLLTTIRRLEALKPMSQAYLARVSERLTEGINEARRNGSVFVSQVAERISTVLSPPASASTPFATSSSLAEAVQTAGNTRDANSLEPTPLSPVPAQTDPSTVPTSASAEPTNEPINTVSSTSTANDMTVASDEQLLTDWVTVSPPTQDADIFILSPPADLLARARAIRISKAEVDELRRRGQIIQQDDALREQHAAALHAAIQAQIESDPTSVVDVLLSDK